jgi:hypothetical protein
MSAIQMLACQVLLARRCRGEKYDGIISNIVSSFIETKWCFPLEGFATSTKAGKSWRGGTNH